MADSKGQLERFKERNNVKAKYKIIPTSHGPTEIRLKDDTDTGLTKVQQKYLMKHGIMTSRTKKLKPKVREFTNISQFKKQ